MFRVLFALALSCLVTLSCLVFQSSYAEDFKPEEIPPQRALKLYKAKGVRDIYYLITKDESHAKYMDAGNHYLLVRENGSLRFPRQTRGAVYYDGGSFDLSFENGERLVVPTEVADVGYLGVKMGPMMMSANRAPIHLERVEITDSLLARLGFAKFIAPKTEESRGPVAYEEEKYVPLVSPETVQVIEFTPTDKDTKSKRELTEFINGIDPSRIKINRVNQGGFYGYGESLIIVVTEPEVSLTELRSKLAGRGTFGSDDKTLLSETRKSFNSTRSQFRKASEEQKKVLIDGIFRSMGPLERYFLAVDEIAKLETAILAEAKGVKESYVGTAYNTKARRQHPLYKFFLEKIRNMAFEGYETLDALEHPAAQEIIADLPLEFDFVALDLVRGTTNIGQSYFDIWLQFMISDLKLADQLLQGGIQRPPDNIRISNASGGVFDSLKVAGDLVSIEGRGIVLHFTQRRPETITVLLGLPGKKDRMKTSLIQYFIDADKKAEKMLQWSALKAAVGDQPSYESNQFEVKGLGNIDQLLATLAWTPWWARGIDGFSLTEYQVTVAETFTTLFDIASTSLKTTGTMTGLIDASIHLLTDIQNSKEYTGRNPTPRLKEAAANLENRLRIHFQKATEAIGYARGDWAVKACKVLLSPDSRGSSKKIAEE